MEKIANNGVNLEIQRIAATEGKSTCAPIVFLHEGLGSVALWRDWPASVCKTTGRAGCVYSRRGYGWSDAVIDVRGPSRKVAGLRAGRLRPDYMHEEAWQVLPELLHALEIEKPVLIGHSDGGSIALLHASRFAVSGVVVLAPHVLVEDVAIASITQARIAYESGDLRARLAPYHADVDGAFWQWNDVWLSKGFRNFDIREECKTIAAPVLAIQGYDDPYGTMFQVDEIARVTVLGGTDVLHNKPVELLKIEACRHSPHRDQTEKTTQAIAQFLQNLP